MRSATVRCGMRGGMRGAVGFAAACRRCVGGTIARRATVARAHGRRAAFTTAGRLASTDVFMATAATVRSSAAAAEAMTAPAMAIAPVSPGAYTQEDAVVEIARPIKAHGCASVGCVVIVAV